MVGNLWGMSRQTKVLWIHYDEKWFWGLVTRANAKCCPELGVHQQVNPARHRSHIEKIMCIAVIGYAFRGDPLAGGEGVKIMIRRCQSARLAQKAVFDYMGKDDNGRPKYHNAATRYETADGATKDTFLRLVDLKKSSLIFFLFAWFNRTAARRKGGAAKRHRPQKEV